MTDQKAPRLEMIPLAKLKPYERNARTHSPDQIQKLRASLRQFGFVNPCLIDVDYGIIAGHGRVEAAKAEGIIEVPCVFVEHLTEAQKRAYILADNKLSDLADWDFELLESEIFELKDLDFDIDMTDLGFKDYEKLPSYTIAQNEVLPFTAVHYMITADVNQNDQLLALIEQIKQIEGVTVECSCNRNR